MSAGSGDVTPNLERPEDAPPGEPPPPARRSRTGLFVGLGLALLAMLVLGSLGVVVGTRAAGRARAPRANLDHWHMAYGVYLCDRYLAPLEGDNDRAGIHSHGDGIVHVEPTGRASAGGNADFARFEEAHGLRVSGSALRWLDGPMPVRAEVSAGCNGRPAEIVTFVDGRRVPAPPGRQPLRDLSVIVAALVPKGTSYADIGPPPSLDDLAAVSAGGVP